MIDREEVAASVLTEGDHGIILSLQDGESEAIEIATSSSVKSCTVGGAATVVVGALLSILREGIASNDDPPITVTFELVLSGVIDGECVAGLALTLWNAVVAEAGTALP